MLDPTKTPLEQQQELRQSREAYETQKAEWFKSYRQQVAAAKVERREEIMANLKPREDLSELSERDYEKEKKKFFKGLRS